MALVRGRRMTVLLAGAGGALMAYLFDPARGRARRAQLKDRVAGAFRSTGRRAGRVGRRVASDTQGLKQRLAHRTPEDVAPNDPTLAHAVESRLFQGTDFPKGRINVMAENGVIVLNGEVDHPEQVREIEDEVRKVPGVVDVKNHLHLPKTTPENKQEALEASEQATRAAHPTG